MKMKDKCELEGYNIIPTSTPRNPEECNFKIIGNLQQKNPKEGKKNGLNLSAEHKAVLLDKSRKGWLSERLSAGEMSQREEEEDFLSLLVP